MRSGWLLVVWGVIAVLFATSSALAQRIERAPSAIDPSYKLRFAVPNAPVDAAPSAASAPAPAATPGVARPLAMEVITLKERPELAAILRKSEAPKPVDVANVPPLQRGELLISKTSKAPEVVAATRQGARAFRLPYAARFVDPGGALRTVEMVAEVGGGGLRLVGGAQAFAGELFVRLRDRDTPRAQGELPQAIEVLTTAPLDSVQPALLQITTLDRWYRVALESKYPPQSVSIKLRASGDVTGLELDVPVSRPRLVLEVPDSVSGFGLGAATVTVRSEALPAPSGRLVVLSPSMGQLTLTQLTLNEHGVASTELRSSGLGSASISATSSPLVETVREVRFAVPLSFLVSALLGGSIGAMVAFVRRREELAGSQRWLELVSGVLIGLLVAVLGALGVNVTGIALPTLTTEAAVLVLSAAGALGLAGPLAHTLPGTRSGPTKVQS